MHILKIKKLDNSFAKALGLLSAPKAYPVYFKTRFGIHTFLMRFPIDVLILDANNIVVKMAENLTPNKIFLWFPTADQVIELPTGEIKRNKIKLGDKLTLQFTF
ncbi:MAG TPA: DUF192 domain-containing protein [Patescibacteria group bacterium]